MGQPQDAEHDEWAASVQARLDEALHHLADGIDTPWRNLPCAGYPHCLDAPVAWPILPRGYTFTAMSDLAVVTFDGEWHFGAEAEALMHAPAVRS